MSQSVHKAPTVTGGDTSYMSHPLRSTTKFPPRRCENSAIPVSAREPSPRFQLLLLFLGLHNLDFQLFHLGPSFRRHPLEPCNVLLQVLPRASNWNQGRSVAGRLLKEKKKQVPINNPGSLASATLHTRSAADSCPWIKGRKQADELP